MSSSDLFFSTFQLTYSMRRLCAVQHARRGQILKFSSTTDTTTTDNLDSQFIFPWRPRRAPSEFSFKSMFFDTAKFVAAVTALNSLGSSTEEFIEGAESGFRCAITSIFQHPKLENRILKPPEELLLQKKKGNPFNRQDVLTFDDMFEEMLANHYKKMMDRFVISYPHYKVCYDLLKIKRISFYSGEAVMFKESFRRQHDHLECRSKGIISSLAPPSWDLERDGKLPNPDRALLRFWVNFPCLELFYIQDMNTNIIVQGSIHPATVHHQLLLEGTIDISHEKKELVNGWKIVDVDGWLNGQEDKWTQQRLS